VVGSGVTETYGILTSSWALMISLASSMIFMNTFRPSL
jgi:hypothetical protein